MARDESLLFHHLKMTGEAIAWVERTINWAEPDARSTHILDAHKLIAQATRTLAKGKRRPWSNPQEHLEAAYSLGCEAWVELFYTLKNMPPQYRWQPYDVPCINGCRSYSDLLWVGNYFCFDCWANAWTNYAIQRAYWASDDYHAFANTISYDALHAESMETVARMKAEQQEQISKSEEQQRWHADLREKIEQRQREVPPRQVEDRDSV